ncbi:hypothetical protein EYF80_041226 [Liparis tanakae]|uniref:Uncharacterized protein n=1 Tax=Liparis tanakae TaxID=230148 RepID=A0A4Z2G6Z4_9TELE|nr:hypothetical protein EYF80_041226 [Liparis tanakae]
MGNEKKAPMVITRPPPPVSYKQCLVVGGGGIGRVIGPASSRCHDKSPRVVLPPLITARDKSKWAGINQMWGGRVARKVPRRTFFVLECRAFIIYPLQRDNVTALARWDNVSQQDDVQRVFECLEKRCMNSKYFVQQAQMEPQMEPQPVSVIVDGKFFSIVSQTPDGEVQAECEPHQQESW